MTVAWVRTRTRTAGSCSAISTYPTSEPTRSRSPAHGGPQVEGTHVLGTWLRDVMAANTDRFRIMGPDETASNRLQAVFETTDRVWMAKRLPGDDHLAPDGRVMEVLSEHLCEGWLEGYLLTGRHGLFNSYEAFIHIVDSMFNQHAKWLKESRETSWRLPIASLNYLLSSHVWRQDHNGFSHQDPGFIDLVVNKKAEIVRVYFPPDANCLLSVADHCLRSRDYVNVVVAGKQPQPAWLTMAEALQHCALGIGTWEWASTDAGGEADVVLACVGDVPTLETLAAAAMLREHLPSLRVTRRERRRPDAAGAAGRASRMGCPTTSSTGSFPLGTPVIFAYHGYPALIHQLTYKRANHDNFHVHGYRDEGTTTTPFDMVMLNDLDRFRLVVDVIDRVPGLANDAGELRDADARTARRSPSVDACDRRRHPERARLDVARLMPAGDADTRRQRRVHVDQALGRRRRRHGHVVAARPGPGDDAMERALDDAGAAFDGVVAVGHRIVHGGAKFVEPVVIDATVVDEIDALAELAPLHNDAGLAGIRVARAQAARRPAGRVLRHRVPRHDARRRHARTAGRTSGSTPACAGTASTG